MYDNYGYTLDPHGAIAYLALLNYSKETKENYNGIFLETAHPAKFKNEVDHILDLDIEIPGSLAQVIKKHKQSIVINPDMTELKALLVDSFGS